MKYIDKNVATNDLNSTLHSRILDLPNVEIRKLSDLWTTVTYCYILNENNFETTFFCVLLDLYDTFWV